jgi:hypothetical protein
MKTEPAMTGGDWAYLPENVNMHTMMNFHYHADISRNCMYHARLGKWTFGDIYECLLDHPQDARNEYQEWDVQTLQEGKWRSWYAGPMTDKAEAVRRYESIVHNVGRVAKDVRLVEIRYSVIRDSRNYKYGTNN